MPGSVLFVLGVVALLAGPTVARTASVPLSPSGATVVALADDPGKSPEQAKDAGTLEGQVVAIDYHAGTMSVQSGAKKVDVVVLPSTNIQGPGNAFHTIADIHKGAHVRVLMSRRGDTFTAQLINLR